MKRSSILAIAVMVASILSVYVQIQPPPLKSVAGIIIIFIGIICMSLILGFWLLFFSSLKKDKDIKRSDAIPQSDG